MFGIIDRIEHGWDMTLESLNVLRSDKELLVFPALGLLTTVMFTAGVFGPIWYSGYGKWFLQQEGWAREPILWVAALCLYVVNYFLMLFFESAVVACAIIRMRGGDPTISDGFRAAISRLPQLFAWAVFGGTIGLLLKFFEDRSDRWQSLVTHLLGYAWALATFFIVPVLVVEKVGPVNALRRSGEMIRKYWGETFVADLGIGLIGFLGMLPGFLLFVFGGMSLSQDRDVQGFIFLGCGFLWLVMVSMVTSILEIIARAGLYMQAVSEKRLQRFEKRILGES